MDETPSASALMPVHDGRRRLLAGTVGGLAAMLGAAPVALARATPVVGVIKIVSHAALDADERGFFEAMAASGFRDGVQVRYERRNAEGDAQRAAAIAAEFVRQRVSLIYTIATPTSQAVVRATRDIPIVFSSVTDPVQAGLVPAGSRPGRATGTNVTGVSDQWPVALQMETYARLVPKARRWGTIYNPAEPNSVVHIGQMRDAARQLGLSLREVHVGHRDEVEQAAQSLMGQVQAINITSDNTTVSNLGALVKVCETHRVPLFAGDVDSVDRGALAAFGMDYFLVGYSAGRKASLVLKGVAPGTIPWGPVEKFSLVINLRAARAMGVEVPADMQAKADRLIA
jgi:putative ABC transport system substrate-binding protein